MQKNKTIIPLEADRDDVLQWIATRLGVARDGLAQFHILSEDEYTTIFKKKKTWAQRQRWAAKGPKYKKIAGHPTYFLTDVVDWLLAQPSYTSATQQKAG